MWACWTIPGTVDGIEIISFENAFNYLDSLKEKGQIGTKVLDAVRQLTAEGIFDAILKEARDGQLSDNDTKFLRSLSNNH